MAGVTTLTRRSAMEEQGTILILPLMWQGLDAPASSANVAVINNIVNQGVLKRRG